MKLGRRRLDKDGNVIEHMPATFEEDDEARTLVIGFKDKDFTPVTIDNIGMILEEIRNRIGFKYTTEFIKQDYYDVDCYWTCSGCREDFVILEDSPQENVHQYCPKCGRYITEYIPRNNESDEQ